MISLVLGAVVSESYAFALSKNLKIVTNSNRVRIAVVSVA